MTETEKRTTNIAIRASIEGIVDILGTNGAKILFKNAGLIHIFENPPGYDWNPSITITEQASIYSEVANLLGLNGAISLWRRMGYTVLKYAVEVGHTLDAFNDLPQDEKFYKGMELFTLGSGKGRVLKMMMGAWTSTASTASTVRDIRPKGRCVPTMRDLSSIYPTGRMERAYTSQGRSSVRRWVKTPITLNLKSR